MATTDASDAAAAGSPGAGRGARRKAETRIKLLDAARELIAERGAESLRIAEITERADVGFGSFYNHFDDKSAIVSAVVEATIASHGAAIQRLAATIEDPAEVVSIAHRHYVRLAQSEPTLAWVLVRLEGTHPMLEAALGEPATKDLLAGLDAGRFAVPDLRLALLASGGALIGVMRAVLEGTAPPHADVMHAHLMLRMLGVPDAEAARIAAGPFPD